MKIPFVDLLAQYNKYQTDIDAAINSTIQQTAFIGGKAVKQFEKDFAAANGVKNCIAVANGTDAIYIVMRMLGIGAGDEVITTAASWISTSETISQTGARPVFVDIDPDYYTINTELIGQKITAATKAIIPVHFYGQAAAMDKIAALCKKHNLYLIEDCAQAHFAKYDEQFVGSFGDAATYSFYPGKNLGAYGDAGAITTNNDALAEKCRMYANHGALVKHNHIIEGINSRLDGLQAAILNAKLPHIHEWNNSRLKHAQMYNKLLGAISQVTVPVINPRSKHIFHVYCIRTEKRDELKQWLADNNIETAIHYPVTLPNMPAYSYLGYTASDFPVASGYQDKILSLPMFPELTDEMIAFVCKTIAEFFNK